MHYDLNLFLPSLNDVKHKESLKLGITFNSNLEVFLIQATAWFQFFYICFLLWWYSTESPHLRFIKHWISNISNLLFLFLCCELICNRLHWDQISLNQGEKSCIKASYKLNQYQELRYGTYTYDSCLLFTRIFLSSVQIWFQFRGYIYLMMTLL